VVGLGFANAGLTASMLHLGHPERAWRAFSQWRSSWLAREGVAALSTFPPAIAFATLWWVLGPDAPATRTLGVVTAVLSLVTVGCTAMIYASLKPIRQWHNPHTAPDYLIFAVFSGAVLLAAIWALWFGAAQGLAIAALIAAVAGGSAKFAIGTSLTDRSRSSLWRRRLGLPPSVQCARLTARTSPKTTSFARWATRSRASTRSNYAGSR
jgi:DMSO reductase anchor subunit